ncbi:MAG: hypothetical protein IKK16_06545, partial [Bacteroidaceae bacterium]|nr:hypothetical protein [Bacteroidaceae bacterium]
GLTTLDAASNTIEVTITDGEIAANATTNAAKFTIAKSDENYTIMSASGYYIGKTANSNGLDSKTTVLTNTLSINDDASINIISSGGPYLRFNATSGQERFRYFKTSTYTSQKAIALYKFTAEQPGEGGGDDPVDQQLAAPTFSPAGGAVEAGTEVTITAPEGSTLVYTVNDGVSLSEEGVNTATVVIDEETTIEAYATQDGFEPSEVVTATYTIKPSVEPEEGYAWNLVIDDSTLAVGDKVVIAAADSDYALSTNQKTSNRGAVEAAKNGNLLNINADVQQLTLEADTVDNTWAFNTGDGYLYAASSSGNQLKTQKTNNENGIWTITIDSSVASIVATESSNRNVMQYNPNNGSPLFACYASATQQALKLYRYGIKEVMTENNNGDGDMYYLLPGSWENNDCALYAAEFINKNTGRSVWVQGFLSEHRVFFFLNDVITYTHIKFYRVANPDNSTTTTVIENFATMTVLAETEELTWDGGNKMYSIDEETWVAVPTALNRVELACGIGYAYGVVSAEGAIEVYNVNGAVVARGNDNVDLRGLGRGVYIIRNGNQVRKVVR